VPAPELAHEIAVNPIQWSLALVEPTAVAPPGPANAPPGSADAPPGSAASPSAFGAGFFDDAADVPGSPVLFYTLRGAWDVPTGKVELVKRYDKLSEDLCVTYNGTLAQGPDGQPVLTGAWRNQLENTHGTFACRLEESS